MLLAKPWREERDAHLTNPEVFQGSHHKNRLSKQEYRLNSDKKVKHQRPESVSDIQRRLQYLERKMQSINLEDSSMSMDSMMNCESKLVSPSHFLSEEKAKSSNRFISKHSIKKQARPNKRRKESREDPNTSKKNRQHKNQSASIQEQGAKTTKPKSASKTIRQRETNQTKSLNHRSLNPVNGDIGNRPQVQKTLNLSEKSLSERSARKWNTPLQLDQERRKIKKIERELLRFQKENRLLRIKLKQIEGVQPSGKKLKGMGLTQSQKSELIKKSVKEGASKQVGSRAPTKRNHHHS